jgi:hypothetical protein
VGIGGSKSSLHEPQQQQRLEVYMETVKHLHDIINLHKMVLACIFV